MTRGSAMLSTLVALPDEMQRRYYDLPAIVLRRRHTAFGDEVRSDPRGYYSISEKGAYAVGFPAGTAEETVDRPLFRLKDPDPGRASTFGSVTPLSSICDSAAGLC